MDKIIIKEKLEILSIRFNEISNLINCENVVKDLNQYRKLTKEHAEILPIISNYNSIKKAENDILFAEKLIKEDELIRELAEEEICMLRKKISFLEKELIQLLIPKNPNDKLNVFLEIRAGTGGRESAIFVGELLRMYLRYSEKKSWKTEIMSISESEYGGYKEIIVRIIGRNVYSKLKFESGCHRVQRIPVTETQGRIHTSACTVAVMPEVEELNETPVHSTDLRIDTFRASGAGGQHINKTDSAVRITHIPTGIVVECQNGRSQHKNKEHAFKVLVSRIKDMNYQKNHAKESETRKNLIGSGDRSEKIRTYNFAQNRITDHRINLTLYRLQSIIESGDLDELVSSLSSRYQLNLFT